MRYVAGGTRPGLQSELGHWLEGRPRFRDFVTANQDKIRKKLSTTDEDSRQDVRAELAVAYALLGEPRFDLAFEAYGAGQTGPDFTVTFRANQQFNLEVTRLRSDSEAGATRLAHVIAGKLRQLPGDRPNALVISARNAVVTEGEIIAAQRAVKAHADTRDDAFFARRGLKTAREGHAQYLHLSGIYVLDARDVIFTPNREARRPLAADIIAAAKHTLAATVMRQPSPTDTPA